MVFINDKSPCLVSYPIRRREKAMQRNATPNSKATDDRRSQIPVEFPQQIPFYWTDI
jgi:hypothetical protein